MNGLVTALSHLTHLYPIVFPETPNVNLHLCSPNWIRSILVLATNMVIHIQLHFDMVIGSNTNAQTNTDGAYHIHMERGKGESVHLR